MEPNLSTDEEGFKKVTGKRRQGRKNTTVSKPSNPSTSNNYGILKSQNEDLADAKIEVRPTLKCPHQDAQKAKNTNDSNQPAKVNFDK